VKVGTLRERANSVIPIPERTLKITKTHCAHDIAAAGSPFDIAPWADKNRPRGRLRASTTKKRGEKQGRSAKTARQAISLNVGKFEQPVVFAVFLQKNFVE
jgi:hypothetical protein